MCCQSASAIVALEIASGVAAIPANLQGGRILRVVTPSTNGGAVTVVSGRVTVGPGVDADVEVACPGAVTGTNGDFITLFLAGV